MTTPSTSGPDAAAAGQAPAAPPLPDGLLWRPLTYADIPRWHALIQRIADQDQPDWVEQRADLEEALRASKNDPRRDTIAGFDADGDPRAFGRLSRNPGSSLIHGAGGIDPAWRGRGIGRAVLTWQAWRAEMRLRETGQAEGIFRNYVEERNPSHLALLTASGSRIVRYFTEMTRPLDQPIPELPVPDGLELVTFAEGAGRGLSELVRLAHNDAFQDHWGSEPRDQESWQFTVSHPEFRADWSVALLDPSTGEVAAYQLSSYDPDSERLLGRTEGYTDLLGVRRAWRGRGLAPALLAEAMRRYRAAGMQNAGLGVDTENPSGALGLYERMGYVPTQRSIVFDLPLSVNSA
ncbi:GNAT family N-acetyltransferase [Arthrobacter pityocampae]|uniref:GNAT family N-acetyltransferase n=1 Tax=Arthrobacter pityocampae TaxID=547334 RepID=A0A2S5J053_9MICC|nr:GNAT family N-acetyltransferase [Arthrobacter pityocampae]PPB50198.1 GNAT family N-acetyltransferase [Arthrobacter pityocampae]